MDERKTVAVAVPLNFPLVFVPFWMSWTQMIRKADYRTDIYVSNQSLIDKMRDHLAKDILKEKPDYILWIDVDQLYPMDTINILCKHVDEGHLVVGGVTPDKRDGDPLVYKWYDDDGLVTRDRNLELNRGLVKVDAMGFGGVMTHPSVFEKFDPPYFERGYAQTMEGNVGEDLAFYNRCRKAGVDVWCDTDLHYNHVITSIKCVKEDAGLPTAGVKLT